MATAPRSSPLGTESDLHPRLIRIAVDYAEGNGMTAVDSATWLAKPGTLGRSVGPVRICADDGTELPELKARYAGG